MWCTSAQPASARRPETRWRFHLSRCPGFGVHFSWPAQQVDVFYFHDYTFLGPMASWFGGNFTSVTLNARATMRVESNVTGLP